MFNLSSAKVKRCDVKVKTEDYSYYLKNLGLEKFNYPDLSKEDTSFRSVPEDQTEEVGEITSIMDSVEENSQEKEMKDEETGEDEDTDDSVEGWYHGTTFTCSVCNYQSQVLKIIEKHIEKEHGCELKQFSKDYNSHSAQVGAAVYDKLSSARRTLLLNVINNYEIIIQIHRVMMSYDEL